MSYFSIKAASQATGLSIETLRAWERRYEVVRPVRDPSGRRSYSASDVARLRLLRSATELGHTISKLAQLSNDELAKLVHDFGGLARNPARGLNFVERALDATEHSDPLGVEEAITSAMSLLPAAEVVSTVIGPLVREVGERWHRGEATIAQEHMVSDIVRRLIISASRGYVRSDAGPCIVLATLSGERHEIGLLMCSWLAAASRFRTHYLGVDCPPEEIARFALEVEARAVLVSLEMPENSVPVMEHLRDLAYLLRGKCEVWIGGGSAGDVNLNELPPGCIFLSTPGDFESQLAQVATSER